MMSMKNMSKADLHKMMYRGGYYHGFRHQRNTVLLEGCYTRTVLATALSLMVHSHQAAKKHQYKTKYMDYMVHHTQTVGMAHEKPYSKADARVSDMQYELALQLLYFIHDDDNVDIEFTKMSGLIVLVALTLLKGLMKSVPRDDIHIIIEATMEGMTNVELNDLNAKLKDIDKVKI